MLDFLEKDLEDIIFDNRDVIHKRGFEVLLNNTFRQYQLPSGKKVDIISYEHDEKEILVYIIELKRDKTDEDAMLQAFGYFYELYLFWNLKFEKITCKIILVGSKIMDMPIIKWLTIPTETYSYDFNPLTGIKFTMQSSNCDVAIDGKRN